MNMESPMCANACGFYGSVENKNMCSKCYKDHLKQQGNKIISTATSASIFPWANQILNPVASLASEISSPSSQTSEGNCSKSSNTGSNKNRCESCNKKVGVLGFQCRCGGMFCGMHRYPEEHTCNVDRKKLGRDVLAKQNPVVRGEKLEGRI